LDATVQRQVLQLLSNIREQDGLAVLLISHDISVIGQMCDRVLVMFGGRIIEELPAEKLFTDAKHPYTRALVGVVPDMETDRESPLPVIDASAMDAARTGALAVVHAPAGNSE